MEREDPDSVVGTASGRLVGARQLAQPVAGAIYVGGSADPRSAVDGIALPFEMLDDMLPFPSVASTASSDHSQPLQHPHSDSYRQHHSAVTSSGLTDHGRAGDTALYAAPPHHPHHTKHTRDTNTPGNSNSTGKDYDGVDIGAVGRAPFYPSGSNGDRSVRGGDGDTRDIRASNHTPEPPPRKFAPSIEMQAGTIQPLPAFKHSQLAAQPPLPDDNRYAIVGENGIEAAHKCESGGWGNAYEIPHAGTDSDVSQPVSAGGIDAAAAAAAEFLPPPVPKSPRPSQQNGGPAGRRSANNAVGKLSAASADIGSDSSASVSKPRSFPSSTLKRRSRNHTDPLPAPPSSQQARSNSDAGPRSSPTNQQNISSSGDGLVQRRMTVGLRLVLPSSCSDCVHPDYVVF